MGNSDRAVTYPNPEQYERWKGLADDMDYSSVSQFIQDMTEAGIKKFDAEVNPDETERELREHRNELKRELDAARDRIGDLEDRLYRGERGEILDHVRENPGADFAEIVQHVIDDTPRRVTDHIEDMLGDDLVEGEDGGYYPAEDQ